MANGVKAVKDGVGGGRIRLSSKFILSEAEGLEAAAWVQRILDVG